jgi:glycosyltransferase involved in cell wall biosynthesis
MTDLSIVIPARNEMFLAKTIENILENKRGDTEVIAIMDGYLTDPPIKDHDDVHVIYHSESIGQRAATNEGVRMSDAKYVMKADGHCAFDEGFDVKLMKDIEYDWTVIPRMYNLHAFDWKCTLCGNRTYQGPYPKICEKDGCSGVDFEREIVWEPRKSRKTDHARFDNTLRFKYWGSYGKRQEVIDQGAIKDTMCFVGACFMMHRDRYWELEGLDEKHGSWGQMGVEISCKTWLSGGRLCTNTNTWFSHMFRTQADFSFPYPNPGISKARRYSRKLWFDNTWPKAIHDLSWLVDKFSPVPDWMESKGIVYYTDNRPEEKIIKPAQSQLKKAAQQIPITSVSLLPMDFGENITLGYERGILTMFKQILAGLEASDADIIFLCEHDILYHPTHFDFVPPSTETFYYNENTWKVDADTGQALFYWTKQTSGCCASRTLLLDHYRKRVKRVEKEGKYDRAIGFEPGCHTFPRGIDEFRAKRYMSEFPNIDLRHGKNLTKSRWSKDQFRSQKHCKGWTMADEVEGWGVTKGRMEEFLKALE